MSGCNAKAKSEVEIMWTNQHGTGPKTDDKVETQVILQYMCQPYPEGKMATNDVNREFKHHTIRNGQTLTTQHFANGARESHYIRRDRGLHEPANYYQAYFRRERNKGENTIKITLEEGWEEGVFHNILYGDTPFQDRSLYRILAEHFFIHFTPCFG